MKKRPPLRRQIFVLTPEEKKAVACVMAALVLGIATKQYRATHPRPPSPPTAKEQQVAKRIARAASARARSARGQAAAAAARTPLDSASESDDDN